MDAKHASKKKYNFVIPSPIGCLGIKCSSSALSGIAFLGEHTPTPPTTDFEHEIARQINAYFSDPRFCFNVPLELDVTPFQRNTLDALKRISPGTTKTYGELAVELHTSARAIGNACRRNPVPLIIPCHRIVAKASIGGFSGSIDGQLIETKQFLLNHESFSSGN